MNILYVIRDSYRFGGGAELRLLEISRRLVARGHSVSIICGKTEPGLPDYEWIDGIQIYYLKLLPEAAFRFKRFSFYASRYLFYLVSITINFLITRISPDIIVDYISPSPSLVYLLAWRLGLPCCAEVMEYRDRRQWFELTDPVTACLGSIAHDFLLRRFHYPLIITISNFSKNELIRGGFPSERVKVVACGIDVKKFQDYPAGARCPHSLIVVGRLMPPKGHKHLFEALELVRQQIPDIHLHVVGDGPLRAGLELSVRQKGLEKHVLFTGRVTDAEKIALLWRSSIFVMPSLQEGFGMVLLEAMACGLPVVAFDLPVYRELLNSNCGYFVPKGDTQAMATQIIHLLQDDEARATMSAYNFRQAQLFDWESVAEAEEDFLLEMLRVRSPSKPLLNRQIADGQL
jgi:glycosyltransferase involved in cell wall biosynthesis